MSKTSKIIITALLVAVLLLGIGYAAIQSVTLNISGTAAADPNQENFKVMFTGTPVVSDEEHVTASITDDINATINVSGLTKKGEIVSATYTVQNASTDLSVATTNSNTEYFTLRSELAKTSLIAGEATTVTVTVEVTKTPLAESVSSTIGVQLTATPVQPGEEGTSGATNDYSETPFIPTLSLVKTDNIGDYIDLGNNIIGTESTKDDWRILYKDESKVYAILADYLPISQVPETVLSELNTNPTEYPYCIWSEDDSTGGEKIVNALQNEEVWSDFANGIAGATAKGATTSDMIIDSYKEKNNVEELEWDGDARLIDTSSKVYDLYVPHDEAIENCNGYWLLNRFDSSMPYAVNGQRVEFYFCFWKDFGIRPVVSLPLDIICSYTDGVWVID